MKLKLDVMAASDYKQMWFSTSIFHTNMNIGWLDLWIAEVQYMC